MTSRFSIVVTAAARRAVEHELPKKVAAAVVEFGYGALAENPHRVGKPLRDDLAGMWSARRGEYRVISTIDDDLVVVAVIAIDHRRDGYRRR